MDLLKNNNTALKRTAVKVATGLALCASLMMTTAPAHAEGNTLKIGLFWTGKNLDPAVKWNGWTLPRLAIGETLVAVDQNLKFQPVVAESWDVVDDKTVKFQIRSGVTFHNGEAVTADAVKKSIERAMQTTGRGDMKFPVDKITADGQTLTMTTTEPFSTLVNVLADPTYTIVTGFDAEGFADKPIATGPFMVDRFDAAEGIFTSKHAGYWGGEPSLDGVDSLIIKDGNTRALALQSGEIDLTTQLNARDLEMLEATGKFNVQKGPNARIFMARFNMQKPYMKNAAFRQALVTAIDKTSVVKAVSGFAAKGPFPPAFDFAYTGDEPYAYDPAAAMKLLDDAGIKDSNGDGIREFDGENIELDFYARTGHGANAKTSGIVMQQALKEVGIGMTVTQVKSFGDIAEKGDYDILWERWTAAPTLDPQYFLELSYATGAKGNKGGYSSAAYDAVITKLKSAFAKEDRISLANEAVTIALKDAPGIFFYHGLGSIITSNDVTGVSRFPTEIVFIDSRVGKK